MKKQCVLIFMLHQDFSHLSECGSGEIRVLNSVIFEERERVRNSTLRTKVN